MTDDLQALSDAARLETIFAAFDKSGNVPMYLADTIKAVRAATPVVPAEGLREMAREAAGEGHAYLHGRSGARFTDCQNEPCPTRRETLAASPSPDTDRENVMDSERWPCAVKVEGSIGACLIAGTDYRVAEIREHHEASGVIGEPPAITTVIRFDPVPSPDTDAGLDEDPCCERERELRDERVRTAHFHIAHDGTVRHPAMCGECRRLEEQQRGAEAPR